jgi:hypothetical protein
MNNELECIWKEAFNVHFNMLSWHLPVGTAEKEERQNRWCPCRDLKGHLTNTNHKFDLSLLQR